MRTTSPARFRSSGRSAMPADFPAVERRAPIGLAVLTVLLVIAGRLRSVAGTCRASKRWLREKVPPVPDRLLGARAAASSGPPGDAASSGTGGGRLEQTGRLANRGRYRTPKRTASTQPATVAPNVWPASSRESVAPPTQAQRPGSAVGAAGCCCGSCSSAATRGERRPRIGQAQAAQLPAQPEPPRAQHHAAAPSEEASAKGPRGRRGHRPSACYPTGQGRHAGPRTQETAGWSCAVPTATSWRRPMSGPVKATSFLQESPTGSSTRAEPVFTTLPGQVRASGWISGRMGD